MSSYIGSPITVDYYPMQSHSVSGAGDLVNTTTGVQLNGGYKQVLNMQVESFETYCRNLRTDIRILLKEYIVKEW